MIRTLMVLLICSVWGPLADAQDWREPDDVKEFARAVILGEQTPVTLSAENDVDWYRLTVWRDALLSIDVENGLEFSLEDADGQPVDIDPTVNAFPVRPGDYYVGYTGPVRATPYSASISLIDRQGLTQLPGGQELPRIAEGYWPLWGGLANAPLEFSLNIEELSLFAVDTSYESPESQPYRIELVDLADGSVTPLSSFPVDPARIGAARNASLRHVWPGEYTVRLYRDAAASDEVNAIFSIGLPNDGFEPNDTAEMARFIGTGDVDLTLAQFPGDTDWVYLDLPAAGRLELRGLPGQGHTIDAIVWPTVLAGAPDGPALGYEYSERDLARYVVEEGRVYIRVDPPANAAIEWTLSISFTPDFVPSDAGDDTALFVMGLETNDALQASIDQIAAAGRGQSVSVSSDDMELALTLAEIVGETEGTGLTIYAFARAASVVMNQRLFEQERPAFAPQNWIGADLLEENGVFQRREEPDLATTMRDTFKATMLKPFKPKE